MSAADRAQIERRQIVKQALLLTAQRTDPQVTITLPLGYYEIAVIRGVEHGYRSLEDSVIDLLRMGVDTVRSAWNRQEREEAAGERPDEDDE